MCLFHSFRTPPHHGSLCPPSRVHELPLRRNSTLLSANVRVNAYFFRRLLLVFLLSCSRSCLCRRPKKASSSALKTALIMMMMMNLAILMSDAKRLPQSNRRKKWIAKSGKMENTTVIHVSCCGGSRIDAPERQI
jgi:hypothetical protein